MENQESNQETEIVESVESNYSEIISSDLKGLLQYLKDEKDLENENIEIEKQLQNEAAIQQDEIDTQKEKQEIAQKLIDLENEQVLIDSESDFKSGLLDSLDSQNQKMDTYIEKSDGLLSSVNLMNENTELLIENTAVEDTGDTDNMSYYADLTLVMIIWVFLPLYIAYRMIQPLFNKIF